MKYETPQLRALTLAINAIQQQKKDDFGTLDIPATSPYPREPVGAYVDWE
jgi:hypothetical protein